MSEEACFLCCPSPMETMLCWVACSDGASRTHARVGPCADTQRTRRYTHNAGWPHGSVKAKTSRCAPLRPSAWEGTVGSPLSGFPPSNRTPLFPFCAFFFPPFCFPSRPLPLSLSLHRHAPALFRPPCFKLCRWVFFASSPLTSDPCFCHCPDERVPWFVFVVLHHACLTWASTHCIAIAVLSASVACHVVAPSVSAVLQR